MILLWKILKGLLCSSLKMKVYIWPEIKWNDLQPEWCKQDRWSCLVQRRSQRAFQRNKCREVAHVSELVAVHTWVLRTARDEIVLTAKGPPPLNPLHPIQSKPAPASIRIILFGGNISLSLSILGPTWISSDMICRLLVFIREIESYWFLDF